VRLIDNVPVPETEPVQFSDRDLSYASCARYR
jgi:hypothetical protein